MRGSTSTHLIPNISPALRIVSWISSNRNISLSQPRHYATESSKGDPNRRIPGLWIHYLALEFSALMSSKQPHPKRSEGGINFTYTRGFVHYTTLGLQRNASQGEIRKRYYELSKKHHPDISEDPNSLETFRKVAEAYAILGKEKTRRKYDEHEQLNSALMSTLITEELRGNSSSSKSIPRPPVDPTFWNPVKLGSSTFYRPPPGYWAAMNKIMRDREKSTAQKSSSPPHTDTPPPDKTEGNNQTNETDFKSMVFWIAFTLFFACNGHEWLFSHIRDFRAFLVRLREVSENESRALQREDPTSRATGHNQDLVREDGINDSIIESQAQLADTRVQVESSIEVSRS